jgi:hypothetical protein
MTADGLLCHLLLQDRSQHAIGLSPWPWVFLYQFFVAIFICENGDVFSIELVRLFRLLEDGGEGYTFLFEE